MKKFFGVLTAAAVLLGSTMAYAETDGVQDERELVADSGQVYGATFTDNGLKYTELSDGTLEVSGLEDRTLTEVTIPEMVNDKKVTSIGKWAFWFCTGLTSVTIPNSITSIGDLAFATCESLTSVTIPNSVTSIGEGAFNCCISLTSITIPNSVTSIGGYAFESCSSLMSVTIPSSVTSIGDGAFDFCTSLTSVTIPNSVTSIGDRAFDNCTSLTSVTIPNSVTSIGDQAFDNCTSLTSVTIPNSVTSIGNQTFVWCISLTEINVNDQNKNYCSVNGVLFTRDKTELVQYPAGRTAKSYTIPNSVTSIGEGAFSGCKSFTSVTIPNSVTSIGESAFSGCSSLTSVTIPNSITSIDAFAFDACPILTDVYYAGTEADWNEIVIDSNNDPLINATIHYNSTGPVGVPVKIDEIKAPDGVDTAIEAVKVTGDGVNTTLTIKDGLLDVSSLAPGTYTFTFSAKNCAPRAYSNIVVSDGMATGLSEVELKLYGDIDGNGKVNTLDVAQANAHVKNKVPLSGYDLSVCDADKNGKINTLDVAALNAHAKNKIMLW